MQPEIHKLLVDIQQAGEHIQNHAVALTPHQYENDVVLRSLVERQFEIIGEALRRLDRMNPEAFDKITDARRIINFRNVIAHGYDVLDPVIVSQVVCDHLPKLLDDVNQLLKEE